MVAGIFASSLAFLLQEKGNCSSGEEPRIMVMGSFLSEKSRKIFVTQK
jgi:hypothetical protein